MTSPSSLPPTTDNRSQMTPYGMTVLTGELKKLERAVEGERNDTANSRWFRISQLIEAGHIDREAAETKFLEVALSTGLPEREIRATMASAGNGARSKPRANVPAPEFGQPGGTGGTGGTGITPTVGNATVGQTWQPIDLGPVLRGEHTTVEPAVGLARRDGIRLLYAGKEHACIGEMEAGKSWLAAGCAVAELTNDKHVIYVHFEEANPADTVTRLQDLGVPNEAIAQRFHYVAPNEKVDPAAMGVLAGTGASLIVLDGVNEAMALHGWKTNDAEGAADYRRWLVRPFTSTGAAVLSLDHVTKDPMTRGRNAIGSIHKGNGLDGALIVLENASPFGRGQRGVSWVFVTKDRPGYLRRTGQAGKLSGKTFMGSFIIDDTREHRSYLDLAFIEPQDDNQPAGNRVAGGQGADDDAVVLAVIGRRIDAGEPISKRKIRAAIRAEHKMSNQRIDDALERLTDVGRLVPERDGYTVPEVDE